MKKDSIAYTVIFTFVACVAFVLPLALANEGTKPLVAANREFATQSAVLGAFGLPYSGKDGAAAAFASGVTPLGTDGGRSWKAVIGGVECVAVEQSGSGLWGTITIVLAAESSGERILGVRVLAQQETPGLGGRIEEAWFLDQFAGELVSVGLRMSVGAEAKGSGDADPANGLVDGVSGATRTSQAFETIVKAALDRIRAVAGGGL